MAQLPSSILVPVTFDPVSRNALQLALQLGRSSGAQVHVLHVWAAPYAQSSLTSQQLPNAAGDLFERTRRACADQMREFLSSLGIGEDSKDVDWSIHSGLPAMQILESSRELACGWIVMGTHRRRGISHWLIGSVAEEVLRHAPCPVVVVPFPRADET